MVAIVIRDFPEPMQSPNMQPLSMRCCKIASETPGIPYGRAAPRPVRHFQRNTIPSSWCAFRDVRTELGISISLIEGFVEEDKMSSFLLPVDTATERSPEAEVAGGLDNNGRRPITDVFES